MTEDIKTAIDWQRSNAPLFLKMIKNKSNWYEENINEFFLQWFVKVFNVNTADSFGLDLWCKILGLPTFELLKNSSDKFDVSRSYNPFGFGAKKKNFTHGNFATIPKRKYAFTLEEVRKIVKLRAYFISSTGSIYHANKMLDKIFENKSVVIYDNFNMTIKYIVDAKYLNFISDLKDLDLLPRPSGVQVSKVEKK